MVALNLHVGWFAILVGLLAGTILGLGFHCEQWLGGYASWRRRMLRLGHISLVGTGLLNLAFFFTIGYLDLPAAPRIASILFVAGAITMPAVCALAAWRGVFRHLFFLPVMSLLLAVSDLIWEGLLR